jgi:hypothetical protein
MLAALTADSVGVTGTAAPLYAGPVITLTFERTVARAAFHLERAVLELHQLR